MNNFEKCEKRIKRAARTEKYGNSLIIDEELILTQTMDLKDQVFYFVTFMDVRVPMSDKESRKLYFLANEKIEEEERLKQQVDKILELL